ncbi:MAG: FeoA family protein [Candidatus Sedimenticola sp. PURPLELP]
MGSPKKTTPLDRLAVGTEAKIAEIHGDRAMARRLLSLGLRVGSEISVLQHRKRGVVVASAGTRVALGASIADKLLMQTIQHST